LASGLDEVFIDGEPTPVQLEVVVFQVDSHELEPSLSNVNWDFVTLKKLVDRVYVVVQVEEFVCVNILNMLRFSIFIIELLKVFIY
jgi:hypothetical protein